MQSRAMFPIQILFSYWNYRPSLVGAQLDGFLKKGINQVTSFIPWQATESDISHQLTRFLLAAAERRMTVNLVLTPELGVSYANSGLPKDLVGKAETTAVDAEGKPFLIGIAPNVFPLPALLSPEFQKRYSAHLSRLDHLLSTLERPELPVLKYIQFILTGSFWKYYRAPRLSVLGPFLDKCTETSSGASIAYRKWLETYYLNAEFSEGEELLSGEFSGNFSGSIVGNIGGSRWKTRAMDEINLRSFLQQCEEQFRVRNRQLIRRLCSAGGSIVETELYTPEADPSLAFSNFAEVVTGNSGAFTRLSSLLDQAGARGSCILSGTPSDNFFGGAKSREQTWKIKPFIHWSGQGTFKGLTDPEKQFLVLKSLLMVGAQGGSVLLQEDDWFSLSRAFRSRLEMFARNLAQQELRQKTQAIYLSNHLWSKSGTLSNILWKEMHERVGFEARLFSSVKNLDHEMEASLLFVDPSQVLSRDLVRGALRWMATGSRSKRLRTVVLPKTSLYTELGLRELENAAEQIEPMELDLGLPYQVYNYNEGRIVLVEMPDEGRIAKSGGDGQQLWQTFLTAMLSLSEIETHCRTSDPALKVLPFEMLNGARAAFVLNEGVRAVSTELMFSSEVKILDLAATLTGVGDGTSGTSSLASHRFAIEIPPCGMMALCMESGKSQTIKNPALSKGELNGIGAKLDTVSRGLFGSGSQTAGTFPAQA